jgi:addiction module RelB/DinJ family antitoxin
MLGMDMATAINMFLRQVIRISKGIPFEISAQSSVGKNIYGSEKQASTVIIGP